MPTMASASNTTPPPLPPAPSDPPDSISDGPSWPAHPSPRTIGPLYIVHFATTHPTFRLSDFCAAARCLGLDFAFVRVPVSSNYPLSASASASASEPWQPNPLRPFQLVHLPSDEAARSLLHRCVSLRSIWAYWSHGSTYASLHARLRSPAHRPLWSSYAQASVAPTWKAHVFSYSGTVSEARKVEVIQSFAWMRFEGRIQLRMPSVRWGVMEEYLGQEMWPEGFQPVAAGSAAAAGMGGGGEEGNERVDQPQQQQNPHCEEQTAELRELGSEPGSASRSASASRPRTEHRLPRPPTATGDTDPRLVQLFLGRRIDLHVASLLPTLHAPPSGSRKSNDPALEGQHGLARDLIHQLDLKQRAYIGNTSMDAELSLLMASLALCTAGTLVQDPFAGTGSLLYAAAVYGSLALGSDIDGRTMRGKASAGNESGVIRAARQYGVQTRILDCLVGDMTRLPFRRSLFDPSASASASSTPPGFLDAIITDPPYGVRAGAKRLGKRDPSKQRTLPFWMPPTPDPSTISNPNGNGTGTDTGTAGGWSHERPDYIPPTRPYHLDELIHDLLEYAFRSLKPHGRLVFWLPEVVDEHGDGRTAPVQLPRHGRADTEGRMVLVSHSLQRFGRWGRRLVTMEKVGPVACGEEEEEGRKDGGAMQGSVRESVRVERRGTDRNGVFRADADPMEFRNRYFVPRAEREKQ